MHRCFDAIQIALISSVFWHWLQWTFHNRRLPWKGVHSAKYLNVAVVWLHHTNSKCTPKWARWWWDIRETDTEWKKHNTTKTLLTSRRGPWPFANSSLPVAVFDVFPYLILSPDAASADAAPDNDDDAFKAVFVAVSLVLLMQLLLYTIVPPALFTLILLLFVLLFKMFWYACWSFEISVPWALSPISQPPAWFTTFVCCSCLLYNDAGGWCTCAIDWMVRDWLESDATEPDMLLFTVGKNVTEADCGLLPDKFDVVNVVVPVTWFPVNDVT